MPLRRCQLINELWLTQWNSNQTIRNSDMEFRPNLLVAGLNFEKGSFPKCSTLLPHMEFNCRYKPGCNNSITFPSSYSSVLGSKDILKLYLIICSDSLQNLIIDIKAKNWADLYNSPQCQWMDSKIPQTFHLGGVSRGLSAHSSSASSSASVSSLTL